MLNTIGEAQRLIAHSSSVEEALGLAQLKAVEISTAHSGKWDDLVELAVTKQRCAAPRAFEHRLVILIKFLKSACDDPTRMLRDIETEGLAMIAAAKICAEPPERWSERANEVIRTADTADRVGFEKKLIFRLMYLRDVRESALANAGLPGPEAAIKYPQL